MKTHPKRGRLAHLLAPRPGEVRGKEGNSVQVVALEKKRFRHCFYTAGENPFGSQYRAPTPPTQHKVRL